MTETTFISARHQSDHLFLLLGTNPLPNYVAAELLLKASGRLYLVHSTLTSDVAQRFAQYWTDGGKRSAPERICVDEANGAAIHREITRVLGSIGSGQIGMNFTGGTKIMSVYAFLALRDHQIATRTAVTLSYLDARSNRMYIEHGNDQPVISDPVLYSLNPTIEDVVGLHAFRLVSDIARASLLSDLATTLTEAHQSAEAAVDWRNWCNEVLRKNTRTGKSDTWGKENLLSRITLPLPDQDTLRPVAEKMREVFGLQGDLLPLIEASKRTGINKAKHLCEWLDGKWLEHHVYEIIDSIKTKPENQEETRLHDIGMGVRPKTEADGSEFDVDIAVMQGYRLYAISCTTDADPGLCKLKLFEAYVRARNMAGDEARVGLVCMADNPDKIERQVNRSWDAQGKVRVFGRSDLQSLDKRLSAWFTNSGSK